MSRRRKCFVLVSAALLLAAFVPTWFKPVSPLRDAYNQIREGMNAVQVGELVERCRSKHRNPGLTVSQLSIRGATPDRMTYECADGETLTIRWEGPVLGLDRGGHVVGKEYHSAIEAKLRDWWD